MKREYDILATLYINDIEDGSLIEKVEDVFTIDVEPVASVLDDYAQDFFDDLKEQCKLNLNAIDCEKYFRLDLVYLQDDIDTDDEDGNNEDEE